MKANELRFGSVVYFSNYEPVNESQIRRIGWIDLEQLSIDEHTERYLPIPLTADVLEKCGFDSVDRYDCRIGNITFKVSFGGTGLIWQYEHHCNPVSRQATLIYLHQLQNLYLDLTGEELTVNL